MRKQALISVSNKAGVVELARELASLGYDILSTGGTAKALEAGGVPVTEVSKVTGFPECLDGRVKTLHPVIHAGILAMRDNDGHMAQLENLGIDPIDIVVINLYPFRETIMRPDVTLEMAVENIDIGGPTMLRAAAKNWQDVCVLTDPNDYNQLLFALKSGGVSLEQKFIWCQKVFEHTAGYDSMIARWLGQRANVEYPSTYSMTFEKVQDLRYGENPHQTAAFYREVQSGGFTLADARQLHGKELSFNNINDTSAALNLLREFDDTTCAVAIKHANPCGVGVGDTALQAYIRAFDADPVSIFGGIVAINREIDTACAEELGKTFLEVILAPGYTSGALEILGKKKNIRLLELPNMLGGKPQVPDFKKVSGGLLVQSPDVPPELELTVVTSRFPTEDELDAMAFGWRVCKHTRSNAIVLTTAEQTVGIGPGQTNRIGALEIALRTGLKDKLSGSVMASDAFFPFGDCVEAAAKAGVTAIIQPGGSRNDQESIDACNAHGIAMVFTGVRHFQH